MSAADDAEFVPAAESKLTLTEQQVLAAAGLLGPYCPTAEEAKRLEEARRSALVGLGLNPDAPTDPDQIRALLRE